MGLGYVSYVENGTFINPFLITGNTLASNFGIGVDFMVAKNFALGFGTSFLIGGMKTVEFTTNNKVTTMNLSTPIVVNRFDAGVGLKLYF